MAKRFIGNVKGVGVSDFSWEYYLSSSSAVLDGGSWSATPPTLGNNKYLWMRSKVTLTDGTIQYTAPVCEGVWEEIYGIYAIGDKVDGALSDVTDLKSRMTTEENKVQPINKGGTGATTAEDALTALLENKALPITKGGTGATTAAAALLALGVSDYVTEEGETSGGANGYIKFASGLMFQWGSKGVQTGQGASTMKVDFPTAFKDTNYRFLALGNHNFVQGITVSENIYTTGEQNRTTTSTTVSIYKTGNPYWYAIDWFAIGKWK